MIKFLLNHDAKPDIVDRNGCTALIRLAAKKSGRAHSSKTVREHSRKKGKEKQDVGDVEEKKLASLAKLLIEKGADVNARSKNSRTPLNSAACKGHELLVQLLVDAGADVTVQDDQGFTALMYITHRKCPKIAQLLIDKGADVNCKSKCGWTALMSAVWDRCTEMTQLLIEAGADCNAQYNLANSRRYGALGLTHSLDSHLLSAGDTPLIIAARRGFTEILELIFNTFETGPNGKDSGDPSEQKGKEKEQEFCDQPESSAGSAARETISVKIDAVNSKGETALISAAKAGHTETIKFLLKHGAQVNKTDNKGFTPLLHAAVNLHEDVVQLLLKHNAQIKSNLIDDAAVMRLIQQGGDYHSLKVDSPSLPLLRFEMLKMLSKAVSNQALPLLTFDDTLVPDIVTADTDWMDNSEELEGKNDEFFNKKYRLRSKHHYIPEGVAGEEDLII